MKINRSHLRATGLAMIAMLTVPGDRLGRGQPGQARRPRRSVEEHGLQRDGRRRSGQPRHRRDRGPRRRGVPPWRRLQDRLGVQVRRLGRGRKLQLLPGLARRADVEHDVQLQGRREHNLPHAHLHHRGGRQHPVHRGPDGREPHWRQERHPARRIHRLQRRCGNDAHRQCPAHPLDGGQRRHGDQRAQLAALPRRRRHPTDVLRVAPVHERRRQPRDLQHASLPRLHERPGDLRLRAAQAEHRRVRGDELWGGSDHRQPGQERRLGDTRHLRAAERGAEGARSGAAEGRHRAAGPGGQGRGEGRHGRARSGRAARTAGQARS